MRPLSFKMVSTSSTRIFSSNRSTNAYLSFSSSVKRPVNVTA
jgi:hypothetical protein